MSPLSLPRYIAKLPQAQLAIWALVSATPLGLGLEGALLVVMVALISAPAAVVFFKVARHVREEAQRDFGPRVIGCAVGCYLAGVIAIATSAYGVVVARGGGSGWGFIPVPFVWVVPGMLVFAIAGLSGAAAEAWQRRRSRQGS